MDKMATTQQKDFKIKKNHHLIISNLKEWEKIMWHHNKIWMKDGSYGHIVISAHSFTRQKVQNRQNGYNSYLKIKFDATLFSSI